MMEFVRVSVQSQTRISLVPFIQYAHVNGRPGLESTELLQSCHDQHGVEVSSFPGRELSPAEKRLLSRVLVAKEDIMTYLFELDVECGNVNTCL